RLPFVEELLDGTRGETFAQSTLQRVPTHAALEQLESLVPLLVGKSVEQQWNADAVQDLYGRHIDTLGPCVIDVEREEVQIVVGAQGIAVILGISMNFSMTASVEQLP